MGLILEARSSNIFESVAYGKAARVLLVADTLSKGSDSLSKGCSRDDIPIIESSTESQRGVDDKRFKII
jgi:hypothetical protein